MSRKHAFTNDVLDTADATELARRLRDGEVSAQEVFEATKQRLQVVEPDLNAVVNQRYDMAWAEAQTAVNNIMGASQTFAGVPSFIKDNTDVKGLPTRYGSRATPNDKKTKDALWTRCYKQTGLIVLGKTKTPEFGLTATTEFTQAPDTANPWHIKHSTGGSSGGAAALVAAGVVSIAHANDGGGSIRIPAACCGLVGFKPSRGRVPASDMAKGLPIDVVSDGVVTRTVRDAANFFAALEQHYPAPAMPTLGKVEGPSERRFKIGMYTQLPHGGQPTAEVVAAVHDVAKQCERMGHHVEEIDLPFDAQLADDFLLYWASMAAAIQHMGRQMYGKTFDATQLEPLTGHLSRHFKRRILSFPAAMMRLKASIKRYQRLLSREYDLLLCPTLGHAPPELGYLRLDLPFEYALPRLQAYAAYTAMQNVTGGCGVSLPLASSDQGLPIGVHLGAAVGRERFLLEMAYALEDAMPFANIWE